MPIGSSNAVILKHVQALYQGGTLAGLTDGQLLDRFVDGAEGTAEAAFSVLMQRHGPMVLRLCRQLTGDPHAAQDAFQATFLVLVRKARSVQKTESVASWLHGVARRIALRARAEATRRRQREREAARNEAAESLRAGERPESWTELHEEIARLPARYREPIVLCYLEGLTTEVVAQRLGCPKGTILSRLSRARDRLRPRLSRRNLTLPAALLTAGAGTAPDVMASPLTPELIAGMLHCSLQFSRQSATAAALAPTTAVALARGALHTMAFTKLKILGATAVAGLFALGGMQTMAVHFRAVDEPGKQSAARLEGDDPPTSSAAVPDDLRAKLDEATRLNKQLRMQLEELRNELQALRSRTGSRPPAHVEYPPATTSVPSPAAIPHDVSPVPSPAAPRPDRLPSPGSSSAPYVLPNPPAAMRPPVQETEPRPSLSPSALPRIESVPNDVAARTLPTPRRLLTSEETAAPNIPTALASQQPRMTQTQVSELDPSRPFLRYRGIIFAASSNGRKVVAHDPVTREDHSLTLSSADGTPLKVSFVMSNHPNGNLVALRLQGSGISSVAVYDCGTHTWHTLGLGEPFNGVAAPTVQADRVEYDLGRRACTFSSETSKWDDFDISSILDAEPGQKAQKPNRAN